MKKINIILCCYVFLYSCKMEDSTLLKYFNQEKKETKNITHNFSNWIPSKYEVVSDKLHFYSATRIEKTKAYLIKGDIALCNIEYLLQKDYKKYYFCWFEHHSGRITTGFINKSDIETTGKFNKNKWHHITKEYLVNNKTYFYQPVGFKKNTSYLIQGDMTICDDDIIKYRNEEYCYCEFKHKSGKTTSGYLKKEGLVLW